MSVEEHQAALRAFAHARDWEQFHTPRNLALALVGEVGEVAELLQWTSDSTVSSWLEEPDNRETLGLELADVFSYLLRLSDVCGIDLDAALIQKMTINEQRYPAALAIGSSKKYDRL